MTREEAIEFGNMWLQINEDCKDSSTYAFFQMAIKALEQQPSEDCISRAELLNSLKGFEILHNHDELRTNLIYGIMNLPLVTPQLKGHGDLIDREEFKRWIETQDGDKLMTEYYLDALDMQETVVGGLYDGDTD